MADGSLRILLASPAYWPARAFGGPVVAGRELVRRLVERGHSVDVVTTTLADLQSRPSRQTTVATVDGARVHYLGTPLHYRWMGITPTLPWWLVKLPRPDVVHIYGFRDPVTTVTADWCRVRRIPYVFEPLGMFRARLRKVGLKKVLDSSLYRGIVSSAAAFAVVSELEAEELVTAGISRERIVVRGNGFPGPGGDTRPDRKAPHQARDPRRRADRALRGSHRERQGHRVPPRGGAAARGDPRRPGRP